MKRLELLRRTDGRTQVQLGRDSRLSAARISSFERGRVVPPRSSVELKRLALALGLPADNGPSLLDEVADDGR